MSCLCRMPTRMSMSMSVIPLSRWRCVRMPKPIVHAFGSWCAIHRMRSDHTVCSHITSMYIVSAAFMHTQTYASNSSISHLLPCHPHAPSTSTLVHRHLISRLSSHLLASHLLLISSPLSSPLLSSPHAMSSHLLSTVSVVAVLVSRLPRLSHCCCCCAPCSLVSILSSRHWHTNTRAHELDVVVETACSD